MAQQTPPHPELLPEVAQPEVDLRHVDGGGESGGKGVEKMEEFEGAGCPANCADVDAFCVKMEEGAADVPNLDVSDADSTEYSSSVDGDFSDYEDGPENDSGEVRMDLDLDGLPPMFGGWNRVFRKRKLTDHWRRFIQPLMWRCKWIELTIKELQSQVARYDRELLAYSKSETEDVKPTLFQPSTSEEQAARDKRHKFYRRKKRSKIEDMVDVPSYISQHVVFSYFDNKPEALGVSFEEGFTNKAEQNSLDLDDIALNFEWPNLEIKGNDKFLEKILVDIEYARLRVLDLRTQLEKVFYENASDFYAPGMFIPGDRTSLSPRCSPTRNGGIDALEAVGTSVYAPEFENEDIVLSVSAASSYGDAAHPGIVESTVDLLSSGIGNSCGENHISDFGAAVAKEILNRNRVAEEELNSFENVRRPLATPPGVKAEEEEEEDSAATQAASSSETETDPEIAPGARGKSTLKRCSGTAAFHLRRSKRKRKMRKTSPGSWNGDKIRKRKHPRKQGPH